MRRTIQMKKSTPATFYTSSPSRLSGNTLGIGGPVKFHFAIFIRYPHTIAYAAVPTRTLVPRSFPFPPRTRPIHHDKLARLQLQSTPIYLVADKVSGREKNNYDGSSRYPVRVYSIFDSTTPSPPAPTPTPHHPVPLLTFLIPLNPGSLISVRLIPTHR